MAKRERYVRYEVEWWELTESAKRRRQDPDYEPDRDRDEQAMFHAFPHEIDAQIFARDVVRKGLSIYGHATVTKQRLVPIEGTSGYEWEPIGEAEYIDAGN